MVVIKDNILNMKKTFLILTLLAVAFSPLLVSRADAAPTKHGLTTRHHKNTVKKHSTRRLARKHHRQVTA